MTKARDLANIISGGFTASDIPNLDASKITSGSIADARIPNLATSKITSGTFADARLSASSVSQHASNFDDNDIVNDLSTLALRQSSNENKVAYNSNSMSVDVFQDSTGIASNTNAPRNASEYVSTVTAGATGSGTLLDTGYTNGNRFENSNSTGGNNYVAQALYVAPTTKVIITSAQFYSHGTGGTQNGRIYVVSNSGDNPSNASPSSIDSTNRNDWTYNSASRGTLLGGTFNGQSFDNRTGSGNLKFWVVVGGWGQGFGGGVVAGKTGSGSTNAYYNPSGNNTATNVGASINNHSAVGTTRDVASDEVMGIKIIGTFQKQDIATATGNFISNAVTVSSTNKMGAIITYQNQAGTNALNTDIVLQLSADNGSNFTTATLTAMPDFATGIKMARVNDLTVTAGTQLKYKVLFANQSGSKEARIRGVSLQY